jgi:hypothetical protein
MMSNDIKIKEASKKLGKYSVRSYNARCKFYFEGIEVKDKNVIDIGAGKGAISIWAALMGANYVLGLEPDSAGGKHGRLNQFSSLVKDLNLEETINTSDSLLQDLKLKDVPVDGFDIAVLVAVINHLSEESVKVLDKDTYAYNEYLEIILHLKSFLNPNAFVIVTGCGRRNFWRTIGVKNPFARTINWGLHQEPELWIDLFKKTGFDLVDLRGNPRYPFYRLTKNRTVQYFLSSNFVLRFKL